MCNPSTRDHPRSSRMQQEQLDPSPAQIPMRLALPLITVILAAAVVLFALGHPAGAVLGLLGGAVFLGIEAVRQLGRGEGR